MTTTPRARPAQRNRRHKRLRALCWIIAWFHAAALAGPILVLGDSLSAAYGISVEQGWVALLEQRLQDRGYAIAVVNASISGETSTGGRSRLEALLRQHKPDVVIIELGGNDGLRGLPIGTLHANLEAMVSAAEADGAEVLLLGMRIPPNYGRRYTEQFAAVFAKVAAGHDVALVPFLLDGVAVNAKLMQADRVHPTAEAQQRILDNVWPALQPLLD